MVNWLCLHQLMSIHEVCCPYQPHGLHSALLSAPVRAQERAVPATHASSFCTDWPGFCLRNAIATPGWWPGRSSLSSHFSETSKPVIPRLKVEMSLCHVRPHRCANICVYVCKQGHGSGWQTPGRPQTWAGPTHECPGSPASALVGTLLLGEHDGGDTDQRPSRDVQGCPSVRHPPTRAPKHSGSKGPGLVFSPWVPG